MSYEQAVKELAPCGVDCSRCVSYDKGEIVTLSVALKESLVNFEHMAQKMKNFVPVLNDYEQFMSVLEHFANGHCPGCRPSDNPECKCNISSCHKTQNVNFCFECSEYPCSPKTYNESLTKKWEQNNNLMKTIGVDAFYNEQKQKPRY